MILNETKDRPLHEAFPLTFSVGEAERGSTGALHPLGLQRDVVLQQSVFLQQVLHLQQVFPKVGGQEPSLAGREAVSSANPEVGQLNRCLNASSSAVPSCRPSTR